MPVIPAQGAVLDGFGEVLGGDGVLAGQVGDGAGDLEDAVMGTGREARGGTTNYRFKKSSGWIPACLRIARTVPSGRSPG